MVNSLFVFFGFFGLSVSLFFVFSLCFLSGVLSLIFFAFLFGVLTLFFLLFLTFFRLVLLVVLLWFHL